MIRADLLGTVPVRNVLGEGIIWDDVDQCLWWTDIQSSRLYRYAWPAGDLRLFELPERLCSLGLIADDDRLICAFASGMALYSPGTGTRSWLYRPEQGFKGTRFNDGRVDRQGRFWAGTMVEREPALGADGTRVTGSLYSIRGTERQRVLTGIGISNSLCFSPDSSTMYFADTAANEIRAYAFDPISGRPGAGIPFAAAAAPGAPDGSTIDGHGYLWNAQWGGSRVVRYAPSGAVDFELAVPVTRPTCVCFGGPDLSILFVTSATEGMTDAQMASESEAGNVLMYQTTITGIPECRYRGAGG